VAGIAAAHACKSGGGDIGKRAAESGSTKENTWRKAIMCMAAAESGNKYLAFAR